MKVRCERELSKMKHVTDKKNLKICLVGSSGGHLTHLYMLKPFWKDKNRFWVTMRRCIHVIFQQIVISKI